jgi:hypothetical protein
MIDNNTIKNKLEKSIKLMFQKDADLFEVGINERTISHKLAEYLQYEFSDLNVDCEYNRHIEDFKTLKLPKDKIDWDDTEAKTVFPDIIIHRRRKNINIAVIEIKKSSSSVDRLIDENKLKAFTKEPYNYNLGIFLEIDTQNKKYNMRFFKGGEELK